MKHYELIYLVSAQVAETDLPAVQGEIADWITKAGGTVSRHDSLGRKKLAYPIRKEKFGFYFVMEFDCEAPALKEITQKLMLHKQMLRHLVLQRDPLSEKELQRQASNERRAQERMAGERQLQEAEEDKAAHVSKKEAKISLEELDKKLDELLDSDIIK